MRTLVLVLVLLVATASVAMAVDSFFDIWTDLSVFRGPPYPTTVHQGDIAHMAAAGPTLDGHEGVALVQCHNAASLVDIPTLFGAGDNGGAAGNYGVDSFFDILYDAAADSGGCEFCVDSFFDVCYSITTDTGGPGTLVPVSPQFPLGDPRRFFDVFSVDSFFDITYRIEFGNGLLHEVQLHGTVPAGLRLTNVQVMPPDPFSVDSFFDVLVDITQDTPPDYNNPVLSIHQTGLFLGGTVPVDETTWGGVKALYGE